MFFFLFVFYFSSSALSPTTFVPDPSCLTPRLFSPYMTVVTQLHGTTAAAARRSLKDPSRRRWRRGSGKRPKDSSPPSRRNSDCCSSSRSTQLWGDPSWFETSSPRKVEVPSRKMGGSSDESDPPMASSKDRQSSSSSSFSTC